MEDGECTVYSTQMFGKQIKPPELEMLGTAGPRMIASAALAQTWKLLFLETPCVMACELCWMLLMNAASMLSAMIRAVYGQSTPNPGRTVESEAFDVQEPADALEFGLEKPVQQLGWRSHWLSPAQSAVVEACRSLGGHGKCERVFSEEVATTTTLSFNSF